MNTFINHSKQSFFIGLAVLFAIITAVLMQILSNNHGQLVYTLDDPYIHLALAQQLQSGHYGINAEEFSAPSSSILWPLLLTPFANFTAAPLIINITCSMAILYIVSRILTRALPITNSLTHNLISSALVIMFILASNMIGLIFMGMEHSLQLMLVCVIVYGLIHEIEHKSVPSWLIFAIVLAPLIRYECAAISLVALLFLMARGHIKTALTCGIAISLAITGFALFLITLGLEPFPSSVKAKSALVQSGGTFDAILWNLKFTFSYRQGLVLVISAGILALYTLFSKQGKARKLLALATIMALCAHFVAGRYGWWHRYEIYILSLTLLVLLYLLAPYIEALLTQYPRKTIGFGIGLSLCAMIGLATKPYITDLQYTPLAANNIYEQQYQMHRFAVDYYKQPVAVNDLGYVAYNNSNYVLDLWGLGSKQALTMRLKNSNNDWMADIAAAKEVGLVMVYQDWFKNLPPSWEKIGDLTLGKQRISPADSNVAFYATSGEAKRLIKQLLIAFIPTLPQGVEFHYNNQD